MNTPFLVKLQVGFFVFAVALAFSPAHATSITFDKSDRSILAGPAGEVVELDEPDEPQTDPGAFFDTTFSPLFNQTAGVIFFLQTGSIAPTGTYVLGVDSLANLVPLASLSDVFGVSNQSQNNFYNVGYYSGNPNSTYANFEGFGVPGQTFTFRTEIDGPMDISTTFLTADAQGLGYTLTFQSDVGGDPRTVPDAGGTAALLAIASAGIAILNLKSRRGHRISV